MTKIAKCYRQDFPPCIFAGRLCPEGVTPPAFWGEWFENGLFEPLEQLLTPEFGEAYPDTDAYVGLICLQDGKSDYRIGMFLPENAAVPEGYEAFPLPHRKAGVCWVQGTEDAVYGQEEACRNALAESGMKLRTEPDGALWYFERYGCPRFTTPDQNGEVILDIGFFVE